MSGFNFNISESDTESTIIGLQKRIAALEKENLGLKTILKRYLNYADPEEILLIRDQIRTGNANAEYAYKTTIQNTFAAFFIGEIIYMDDYAADFVFLDTNIHFEEFAMRSKGKIIGKKASELKLFNSTKWLNRFENADAKGAEFSETYEDDNIYRTRIFLPGAGKFAVFFENISPDIAAETKIKEHLRFTQMLTDAIPTPVFYKDMEGRYLLCNKQYADDILGVDSKSIIGKTALELNTFFPKEYADFYQEKDIQLIKDKGIQTYEGPIKCANGTVQDFIVNKTLIKNEKSEFTGILGVMQNIDGLVKSRKELANSESRYKSLFNGIRQPIIVVDLEGNIIMVNTTGVKLFEEDDDILNQKLEEKIPALQLINYDELKMLWNNGKTLTKEVRVMMKGKEFWYLSSMMPVNDFFGEKVIQIICNDITEIKHFQSELLREKKRAEEANNLKSTFLANIAHEVRTPMNIINGFVQLIHTAKDQDKRQNYINIIYNNGNKLLDIIDDIVEISMIENGDINVGHEMCSINGILEEASVYMNKEICDSAKNIKAINFKCISDEYNLIYADSRRINQILKKLINNAVTFTKEGEIEIGAELKDKFLEFFVRDTGIGIEECKQDLIFERFRQGDEGQARQYGGTGLGLSISAELVKKMGGKIFVNSRVNKGSIFAFTIPYEKANL